MRPTQVSIARPYSARGKSNNNPLSAIATVQYVQQLRLTKSQKVSAKDCAQIVANRDSELGYAFAIAGYALVLDALLSFVSTAHCGRIPYWPLLAATLAQQAHFGRLLAVKSTVRRIVL